MTFVLSRETSSLRAAITQALTTDTTRSYDAIAAEMGKRFGRKVSTHYVRSLASRISRGTGQQLRRVKAYNTRSHAYNLGTYEYKRPHRADGVNEHRAFSSILDDNFDEDA